MKKIQKEYLSAYEIWQTNRIYWVKTYKTILKYISVDYRNMLKPRITGKKTGVRYYVKSEDLDNFIKKFEQNQLS